MAHCVHHATDLWAIFLYNDIANSLKTKGTESFALLGAPANF
jgi:hypothetical protein